ncbi:dockerin type I domain-containing protein [Paenibacillus silvae]|uniref:AIR9-like A9 domain-containing protein n=1 Tax=Paenibacillus silvae TaxID=1325358 RepID=A0A2W6P7S7_9BACL|nr:dockerin type I domain-containing protein [Paenibacillus silvae]PZT54216.1 hypothetical protein DN757_18380 [Paenibacillus silvae]
MKGKNKRNTLKPIMKKSMLAALGLGIALPVAGSLPQVQAGAIGPSLEISRPVLNEGISWLNVSSEQSNGQPIMPSVPIVVEQSNLITIDLSSHFPSGQFSSISAKSSNYDIASVDVSVDHSTYKLVVVPFASGIVNIELTAQYNASQEPNSQSETIIDNIELYISKKGDFNNDGYVDSADAVELFSYLRNIQYGRSASVSYVEMNKADIDRNGVPDKTNDMSAFMKGYIGGTLGAKDNSYVLTFKQVDDAPYALNGKLNGTMQVGQTITGSFTQLDVDGDTLATAKYQWYTAADVNGTDELAIEQPNSAQYTIQNADVGRYLILKITPVSNSSQYPEGKAIVIRGLQAMEGPPPPP